MVEGSGNNGGASNTNNDGTHPFGPIASVISSIEMRSFDLLSKLGCVIYYLKYSSE